MTTGRINQVAALAKPATETECGPNRSKRKENTSRIDTPPVPSRARRVFALLTKGASDSWVYRRTNNIEHATNEKRLRRSMKNFSARLHHWGLPVITDHQKGNIVDESQKGDRTKQTLSAGKTIARCDKLRKRTEEFSGTCANRYRLSVRMRNAY